MKVAFRVNLLLKDEVRNWKGRSAIILSALPLDKPGCLHFRLNSQFVIETNWTQSCLWLNLFLKEWIMSFSDFSYFCLHTPGHSNQASVPKGSYDFLVIFMFCFCNCNDLTAKFLTWKHWAVKIPNFPISDADLLNSTFERDSLTSWKYKIILNKNKPKNQKPKNQNENNTWSNFKIFSIVQ